jgi:hypothetical protein
MLLEVDLCQLFAEKSHRVMNLSHFCRNYLISLTSVAQTEKKAGLAVLNNVLFQTSSVA